MFIPANFLDPAGDGFGLDDLGILVGIVVAISALTATFVRWIQKRAAARVAAERMREQAEMETRIREAVEHVAAKVQPRNGGRGWDDNTSLLRQIDNRTQEVVEDVKYLRGRLDNHIDTHEHKGE